MKEEWIEYYIYLEGLRRTGETNMFGASPYLEMYFGLTGKEAGEILVNWMKNYSEIIERLKKDGRIS